MLCVVIAERIEDFTRRKNIVTHGRDIVKVLKALIICGDNRDLRQSVYYVGHTEEQVLTIAFLQCSIFLIRHFFLSII